jgi:hypothetical protein
MVGDEPGERAVRGDDEERDGEGADGLLDHADGVPPPHCDQGLLGQHPGFITGTPVLR